MHCVIQCITSEFHSAILFRWNYSRFDLNNNRWWYSWTKPLLSCVEKKNSFNHFCFVFMITWFGAWFSNHSLSFMLHWLLLFWHIFIVRWIWLKHQYKPFIYFIGDILNLNSQHNTTQHNTTVTFVMYLWPIIVHNIINGVFISFNRSNCAHEIVIHFYNIRYKFFL